MALTNMVERLAAKNTDSSQDLVETKTGDWTLNLDLLPETWVKINANVVSGCEDRHQFANKFTTTTGCSDVPEQSIRSIYLEADALHQS